MYIKSPFEKLPDDTPVQPKFGDLWCQTGSPRQWKRHFTARAASPQGSGHTAPGTKLAFWKEILNEYMILFIWKMKR